MWNHQQFSQLLIYHPDFGSLCEGIHLQLYHVEPALRAGPAARSPVLDSQLPLPLTQRPRHSLATEALD